ncbi:MAG: hypothetical protein QM723_20410 [Myxococcaceae bacterium]
MRRLLWVFAAVGVTVTGCFPRVAAPPGELSQPEIDAAKTKYPDATAESLEKGRHVFVDHCDHCHGFPDLAFKKATDWPATAERMGKKAELDAGEIDLLQRWIAAAQPKAVETFNAKK